MPLYKTIWRNKFLRKAKTLDGLIEVMDDAANELREMKAAGVELQPLSEDYYLLSTQDAEVARRFNMYEDDEEEEEFFIEPEYGGESGEGS